MIAVDQCDIDELLSEHLVLARQPQTLGVRTRIAAIEREIRHRARGQAA